MSEIKNVGEAWMAKYNQLTLLPYKGLNDTGLVCGWMSSW